MSKLTIVLTEENYPEVDKMLDDLGIFAKGYTRYIDGELTTVGLRIGEKPGHIIAFWGDALTVTTTTTNNKRVTLHRGVNDDVTPKEKT